MTWVAVPLAFAAAVFVPAGLGEWEIRRGRFPFRPQVFVLALFVWFMATGVALASRQPLLYALYAMAPLALFAALLEFFARRGSGYLPKARGRKGTVRPTTPLDRALIILVAASILLGLVLGGLGIYGAVARAQAFGAQVTSTAEGPFAQEIPPDMVRLTTRELAKSIARQHLGDFGSNVQILSTHVTLVGGRLTWVNAIASENTFAQNYIQGLVLVDANNPDAPPVTVRKTMVLGDGLFFDHNVQWVSYVRDASLVYEEAYPTQGPDGDWVLVQTSYRVSGNFVDGAGPDLVYDSVGRLMAVYEPAAAPPWITQPYSEVWLERMIESWGETRRGSDFDFWAGGFGWVPPSNDRVEISDDVRYVVDPATGGMVALVNVNPIGNDRALAGTFKVSAGNVTYHELRHLNLTGGGTVAHWVEGNPLVPKPSNGFHVAAMPLLYPVKFADGIRWTWYVPIYWISDEGATTRRLAGFSMVDAEFNDRMAVTMTQAGLTGKELVERTDAAYRAQFGGGPRGPVRVTTTVADRREYHVNGTTHLVFYVDATVNGTHLTVLDANLASLPQDVVYYLLRVDRAGTIDALVAPVPGTTFGAIIGR